MYKYIIGFLLIISCKTQAKVIKNRPNQNSKSIEMVIDNWFEMAYSQIKINVIGPPEASRIYAYFSISLNECFSNYTNQFKSFQGYLTDFDPTFEISDNLSEIERIYVANSVLYRVLDYILIDYLSSEELVLKDMKAKNEMLIVSLENIVNTEELHILSNQIADDLISWIQEDNYLDLRDEYYESPSRDIDISNWDPTNFGIDPLEPYWGEIRPFILPSQECDIALKHDYNEQEKSPFYIEAYSVFEADLNLSEDERDIALFWADCPGETATPVGHWMFIIKQLCDQNNLGYQTKIKLYSLTSIGIADAFIQCWRTKYKYNLLRPKTYIREALNVYAWEPLVLTPPFPEYPSGHSVISTCASQVIYKVLGDLKFKDTTHERIGLKARDFKNVLIAAEEARDSRLYGGMHFPMANDMGYTQGLCVSEQIISSLNTFF